VPSDHLAPAGRIVAYHSTTLVELRSVFDEVTFDLEDVLARETQIGRDLDEVGSETARLRVRLEALGLAVPSSRPVVDEDATGTAETREGQRYRVPAVPMMDDIDRLAGLADAHLDLIGVDLSRDPLLQVLPSTQVASSMRGFSEEFGDVSWSTADWAVVLGAGLLGTLLDIVLVRIPQDTAFLGTRYSGSPLTAWLKDEERAKEIRERFFDQFERIAKVPFDASTTAGARGLVSGMRPGTHRLQSLGHDPVLGFIIGVADIMRGTGTYIDHVGELVQVSSDADPVDLIMALVTEVRHLRSDVYTPAGLPPPLLGLLQLAQLDSPFALGLSGEPVPWTDVARYLYANGYDLRHFFTMGIVPGAIEAVIRLYWWLDGLATGRDAEQRKREKAKLASMLLLGHTIATSGTLVKTGLIFGMNPAALNYPQLLRMAPAVMAWLKEAAEREQRIDTALEAEWRALLVESE